MQKIVIGNWKMHGDPAMAHTLALQVADVADKCTEKAEVVLCPPAILVLQLATWLVGSAVKTGGQDCHIQPEGAFTGDTSAAMLKQVGCKYVLVGHSERRKFHHETNADVRNKAARAIKTGLIPVICIGETEEERNAGKAKDVLGEQIRECIPEEAISHNFILAYEPVWAIGSGKTPTADDILLMHDYIISLTAKRTGLDLEQIHVLYGGSVKGDNAREILAIEGVGGVLVGGASLKSEEFCRIIQAA